MNGPVIFLSKGKKVKSRLRGNNLVTIYVLPEGYCAILNKPSYMDDYTWSKVMKVVSPGIRKTKVRNFAGVFAYFILYISNYLYLPLQMICR